MEAGGIWRGLGVLAGGLLHQSPKLGCAGLDLHGVGYVHYLHWVRGVLFLGLGFLCGGSLLHADGGEDDDGYGLDDELVPWNVSNKFERQRMRKLGKRAFSKMHNSKKSPYLFVRPGCVRGKHGLGLKHITDS